MAGLPGAGKTEFTKTIIAESQIKVVRTKYYPFIMDGTMSHNITLNCILSCIRKGYLVKVTYIKQHPQLAWQFTKAR